MDHSRVNITQSSISCGVMELSHVAEDRDNVLFQIASRLYHPARGNPCAFLLISDIAEAETASSRLVARAQELGVMGYIKTSPSINPHTGNVIQVWVLDIYHDAFRKWYIVERVARIKRS